MQSLLTVSLDLRERAPWTLVFSSVVAPADVESGSRVTLVRCINRDEM